MTHPGFYRLDDLKRFASSLMASAGVPSVSASALASALLWFDTAGAATLGIATLANGLEQLQSGAVDPIADGFVTHERSGTANLDGRRGPPLLALSRAAEIATEKARDLGIGLVQVRNVPSTRSAAGIAAGMAIGPFAALILGPGPAWSVALPTDGGLPAVFDPALSNGSPVKSSRKKGAAGIGSAQSLLASWIGPWAGLIASGDGWLIGAISVSALESLSAFHERVQFGLKSLDESDGRLLPGPWEARRRSAREHGLTIDPGTWKPLVRWAEQLGVVPPAPVETSA